MKLQQKFVFPTEVIDEEIRRIEIHRATEEGKQGSSGSVDKAIDREFGTKETNCYVATTISSWLSLEFTWSSITHVDILVPITAGRMSFVSGRLQTSLSNNIFFKQWLSVFYSNINQRKKINSVFEKKLNFSARCLDYPMIRGKN